VKFLESKDSQATWHTSTGYFPVNKGALDTDVDKQWVASKPSSRPPSRSCRNTKLSTRPRLPVRR